ncbi:DUF2334 domain-containing protein [Chloroflexota bacterium]
MFQSKGITKMWMDRETNIACGKILPKVLVLIVPCLFLFVPQTTSAFEQKEITVVFRYDDYSSVSSTDIDVKLINAFQKYDVPSTFGVIPYPVGDQHDSTTQDVVPLTPVKASILKDAIEANVLEVAQHGYSHQTIRTVSYFTGVSQIEGGYTEFSGLDYDSQKQRIAEGKALLEGMLDTQVTTFIPPWNSNDLNTIRALEDLDFKIISAGMDSVTKDPSQLIFLHATCGLGDLQDAIEAARKSQDPQPIIVALFHPYIFREVNRESGLTFQDFEELLMWVTSQRDIRVRTISEATEVIGDLKSHRDYSNFLSSPMHSLSLPFLIPKYYPSSTTAHSMKVRAWLFSTLFYLVALVASIAATFLIGRLVFSRFRVLGVTAKYISLLFLLLFAIYLFRDLSISYRGATVLTCLLGMCVGIWGSFHQAQKRKVA